MPSEGRLDPRERQRWTRVGVLSALALLLGYAETFAPIPVPGVKLGLANVAVLAALAQDDISGAFCVCCIKVLVTGLLFGSPLTFAYSAAGSLLAFAGMAPLSRVRGMLLTMVSVVGSLLHQTGQLAVASWLLGTRSVWYAAPVLFVAGSATGALCGVLATRLAHSLAQDNGRLDAPAQPCPSVRADAARGARKPTPVFASVPQEAPRPVPALMGLAVLVCAVVCVMKLERLDVLAACAGTAAVLAWAAGVSPRSLVRGMVPLLGLVGITLVVGLATHPHTVWQETGSAALRLVAVCALCALFMRWIPARDVAAGLYALLRPWERLGVPAAGFSLAFDVAFGLVPTMGTLLEGRSLRLREIGELIPDAYALLLHRALDAQGDRMGAVSQERGETR